jgi:hypothetical protein
MYWACYLAVPEIGLYFAACMEDVAITQDLLVFERSILAFATQCVYTGSLNASVEGNQIGDRS